MTAALCGSEPLPPSWPSSMYFLALSQAPPELDRKLAISWPVRMVPARKAPSARLPMAKPTTTGERMASRAGVASSRSEAAVQMSITRPYSGRSLPSMIPGCSRNCRRTSLTTVPAERPTARMASELNRKAIDPPMSRPMKILGLATLTIVWLALS